MAPTTRSASIGQVRTSQTSFHLDMSKIPDSKHAALHALFGAWTSLQAHSTKAKNFCHSASFCGHLIVLSQFPPGDFSKLARLAQENGAHVDSLGGFFDRVLSEREAGDGRGKATIFAVLSLLSFRFFILHQVNDRRRYFKSRCKSTIQDTWCSINSKDSV